MNSFVVTLHPGPHPEVSFAQAFIFTAAWVSTREDARNFRDYDMDWVICHMSSQETVASVTDSIRISLAVLWRGHDSCSFNVGAEGQ